LVVLGCNLLGYSQGSEVIVELTPDSALKIIGFSSLRVVDARFSKDNIGYLSRGIGNNKKRVKFPNDFKKHLEETISFLLPDKKDKPKLVLIFRDLIVSENIGTQNQYGYCNMEIEFAKQVDTLLYSLGTIKANVNEKNFYINKTHGKRILMALEDCFRKFDKTKWKNSEGILIGDINNNIVYDYKTIPPKGVYLSYNQMTRRSPLDSIGFEINQTRKSKKFVSYRIDFKKMVNPKLVQFVSDGRNIYMHANRTKFLRCGSYGKYIYFQGSVPITTKTDKVIHLYTGLGPVGLVGGLLFSATQDDSNTNTTTKGVVIDTETGSLHIVTDNYLYKITKQFPLFLKEYRKSKRKLNDKLKVIIELNSKYQ